MAWQWRRSALGIVETFPILRRNLLASCDYELLSDEDGTPLLNQADASHRGWSTARAVRRQERAWSKLTHAAIAGEQRADIAAITNALAACPPAARVLEVGCGSGYFADIIGHYRPDLTYTGVDFSLAMIQLAKQKRPTGDFVQGDATDLAFADASFDVVLDGAALIHIPDWRAALKEYSRISRECIVLSSLTLANIDSTRTVRKLAYGAPVMEYIFSRSELSGEIHRNGRSTVEQVETLPYDLENYVGIATKSETWICK